MIIVAWLVSQWLFESSEFERVGSAVEVGFLLSRLGLYENGYLIVLNLWVLGPLSRLAFVIEAGLVCIKMDFSKTSICGCWLCCRGPLWRLPLIIGACIGMDVGSAVEDGFY